MEDGHVAQLVYRLARNGVTNVSRSTSKDLVPPYAGPTNANVAVSARVLKGAVRVGEPVVLLVFVHWLDTGARKGDFLAASIVMWDLFDGFQTVTKHHDVQNMVPFAGHMVVPRFTHKGGRIYETIPLEKIFEWKEPGLYRGTVAVRVARYLDPDFKAWGAAAAALGGLAAFDVSANDYFFRVLPKEATDAELEAAETEIEQLTVKTAAESLRPRDRRSELEKRLATSRADQVRTGGASSADLSTNSAVESSPPLGDRSAGSLGLITNPLSLVGLALVVWMAFIVVRARRRVG